VKPLTVVDGVEGARDGFTGGVVTSTHATFVPPGLGVEDVVTARLLQGHMGDGEM